MNAHHLIASVAAILFTATTLGVLNHEIVSQPVSAGIRTDKVTNLAPVIVQPNASERRAAALLGDADPLAVATLPALSQLGSGEAGRFSLIQSQLAMPYYSFGNKFGRISKE